MSKQTVIEIGSNLGQDTKKLVQDFPNAIIYSFEPTKELIANVLWPEFQDNNNLIFIPFAVDIENSIKKFYVTGLEDWGSSSLYEMVDNINDLWKNEHEGLKLTHTYNVPTITLYDFCNLYKIEQIDYLWIDAQGNDFNCLKSLKDKISIVKAGVCEADYSVTPYKNTNNYYKNIIEWLKNNNFSVTYKVDEKWPQQVNLQFTNEQQNNKA